MGRDANLWRFSLLHYQPPPPPPQIDPYEFLHEVLTIKIHLHHCNDKIILVSDFNTCKMSQKPYNEQKKLNFERKMD